MSLSHGHLEIQRIANVNSAFLPQHLPHPINSSHSIATQPTQLPKQKPGPFHIQPLNPVNSSSLI